jgi:hypothetical protein
MPKITFNGQEYESRDAMPTEIRRLYDLASTMLADKDQNGVPDLLEGAPSNVAQDVRQVQLFVADGKAYSSLDELPLDMRKHYEQAMKLFDKDGNGVLDTLDTLVAEQRNHATTPSLALNSTKPRVTVVGEGRGAGAAWILAVVLIVLLAGTVVYLLLTR